MPGMPLVKDKNNLFKVCVHLSEVLKQTGQIVKKKKSLIERDRERDTENKIELNKRETEKRLLKKYSVSQKGGFSEIQLSSYYLPNKFIPVHLTNSDSSLNYLPQRQFFIRGFQWVDVDDLN